MSRFGNLEFGKESDGEIREQEVVKNEAFYFAEATTAFEEGEFEKALRSFSKVLEFNAQNTAAWTWQVRALIELGEFREAKLWADKALERFPVEPELLAAKAVALGRCGDLDAALGFSDAAIEERGDTPYIWLARADVLLARSERRADWCFNKALTLGKDNWLIAWLAARIRCFYKQFTLALRHLQHALQLDPGRSVLWLAQGLCQQEVGLIGPARASFNHALELHPGCLQAQAGLLALKHASMGARIGGWFLGLFNK